MWRVPYWLDVGGDAKEIAVRCVDFDSSVAGVAQDFASC